LFTYTCLLVWLVYVNIIYTIRFKKINLFFPCLIISFTEIFLTFILSGILQKQNALKTIMENIRPNYILIEVIIIFIFYLKINLKPKLKIAILYSVVSLLVTFLTLLYLRIINFYLSFAIFEFLLININAIAIFIYNINSGEKLIRNDNLIINNGLFLFINFTMPFYLIENFVPPKSYITYTLEFINTIGYCIFYYTILLSMKWQIKNLQLS
jgi:hypothetical protein